MMRTNLSKFGNDLISCGDVCWLDQVVSRSRIKCRLDTSINSAYGQPLLVAACRNW